MVIENKVPRKDYAAVYLQYTRMCILWLQKHHTICTKSICQFSSKNVMI